MIIAYDINGKVRMVGSGLNTQTMPREIDGEALTVVALTAEQKSAFLQLPQIRDGTLFDGVSFTAIPRPTPTPQAVIISIEQSNPMTHRGHGREFPLFIDTVLRQLHAKINALDAEIATLTNRTPAPLPNIPVTYMIAVIKTVDDAIKAERAKL